PRGPGTERRVSERATRVSLSRSSPPNTSEAPFSVRLLKSAHCVPILTSGAYAWHWRNWSEEWKCARFARSRAGRRHGQHRRDPRPRRERPGGRRSGTQRQRTRAGLVRRRRRRRPPLLSLRRFSQEPPMRKLLILNITTLAMTALLAVLIVRTTSSASDSLKTIADLTNEINGADAIRKEMLVMGDSMRGYLLDPTQPREWDAKMAADDA